MKITSINEFKKYLAEAHMDFGNNPTGGETATMSNTVEYWNGYATSDFNENPTVYDNLEEALEEAIHDWNSEADVPIKALTPETENEIRGYFQAVGSINTEVVAAMITQLGAIDADDNDDVQPEHSLEYNIDSRDVYVDGELFRSGENTLTYEPNDPKYKDITSDNPDDFREYVNPEAIRKFFTKNQETSTEQPEEDIDHLIDEINDLDVYIHENSINGEVITQFNTIVDKYIGEYNPETQDGVALRDTLAEASLSTEQLKALIAELTELKNNMPTEPANNGSNMEQLIPKLISYLGEEYGLEDMAHEGDVALSLENILMPEQGDTEFDNTVAAACKKLEELGWTIEYNDSINK